MSDAFRYWQGRKIDHASSMANVMLMLAIGGMAFILTLIEEKTFVPAGFWSSTGCLCALGAFFLSSSFAFFAMGSRLEDLRATAQSARIREQENRDEQLLAKERENSERAGRRTKRYLYLQMALFGLGVFLLSGVVLYTNQAKFRPRGLPGQSKDPTP